jgi:hypothetical protein
LAQGNSQRTGISKPLPGLVIFRNLRLGEKDSSESV